MAISGARRIAATASVVNDYSVRELPIYLNVGEWLANRRVALETYPPGGCDPRLLIDACFFVYRSGMELRVTCWSGAFFACARV